jgi:hypothetical protein
MKINCLSIYSEYDFLDFINKPTVKNIKFSLWISHCYLKNQRKKLDHVNISC